MAQVITVLTTLIDHHSIKIKHLIFQCEKTHLLRLTEIFNCTDEINIKSPSNFQTQKYNKIKKKKMKSYIYNPFSEKKTS